MGWLRTAAGCDTCPAARAITGDREQDIQLLRAGGWRHMEGQTEGGDDFETILCPKCVKESKRKARGAKELDQEALPLDWEANRIVVGKQGVQAR